MTYGKITAMAQDIEGWNVIARFLVRPVVYFFMAIVLLVILANFDLALDPPVLAGATALLVILLREAGDAVIK